MRHQKSSVSNNGPQFRAQDKKKGDENVQEKNSKVTNLLHTLSTYNHHLVYMNYTAYPCQVPFRVTEILPRVVPSPTTGQVTQGTVQLEIRATEPQGHPTSLKVP